MTNPYFLAIIIPFLFIFCGAFAKKLVRGSRWQRTDFFLGVELCLAAMASAFIYGCELSRHVITKDGATSLLTDKFAATALFLALCFFILLWVLSNHQDWEKRPQNPKGQFFWLGIFSNLCGSGLLVVFVLFVKGI